MNCFDWQNRASDYLDGSLIGSTKREADQHLEQCPKCAESLLRYRLVIKNIHEQPRVALPVAIRQSPYGFALPRLEFVSRKAQWERAPWYVRGGIETLAAAFGIFLIVALIPRAKVLYEASMERRLDTLSLAELLSGNSQAPAAGGLPTQSGGDAVPAPQRGSPAQADAGGASEGEDFNGEVADSESDDDVAAGDSSGPDDASDVRVGNSEIWRFNLRTNSAREIQPKVVQILRSLGVSADTSGLGGIEAPGGIQFDLLVSKNVIGPLRAQLKRLSSSEPTSSTDSDATTTGTPLPGAPFTWYKNKSRRPIPANRARVVIWLSQT